MILKRKLINWLCLSGIIALVFYQLHDMIGAIYYPNYNWLSQAVSDLTAIDSPSFIIASSYTAIYGIFSCLCCVLVSVLIEEEKSKLLRLGVYLFTIMNFISAIGYSLFPLSSSGFENSFQSIMHTYVITILVVLLSIVSLMFIAIGCLNGGNKHKYLGMFTILSLLFMFAGAVGVGIVPKEYFGVAERFSTYSAVVFNAILGIYGFQIFRCEKQ